MKKLILVVMLLSLCVISQPSLAMKLTSLTLDAEDATGTTSNAPGGVFSTNLADPTPQIGVRSNGHWLNTRWSGGALGELSITLKPGINTFDLYGSGPASMTGGYPFYGLILFFDGVQTPPQVAVYNSNGGTGAYSVQAAGVQVISSANGGLWFDKAPGASVYRAADGSSVEVIGFTVSHKATNPDAIGWGNPTPDGYPDIVGKLTLQYTPSPTATISEYPIPTLNSGPNDLVVDPSGNVWFTERDGYKIGKFSAGRFTEYPLDYEPFGISYNPFNNLVYFTLNNYGNSQYGVLSPSRGTISMFPTGLPAASAVECTLLSSGNYWFNGWDSQSVSRANVSGVIQSYIPPSFGYTSGLSEDPQGNLWLTIVNGYEYNPRLLKLDTRVAQPGTSKGFTEIALPYGQATVRRPVAALGKVWLPVMDQSKILSYDPVTKSFKEYPTPTPNAGPSGLKVDRWNRLWFAETLANKIGMLDLRTGSITEFSIPTPNSQPGNIAIDLDRDTVYFTEAAGNKIGKLTLKP